jgi:hypothetical protein
MFLGMNFTFGTEYLVGSEKGTQRYGLRQSRAAGGGGMSPWPTLYFGRRDLEKGRARATRLFFAMGVDPRLDYLPGVRSVEDVALGAAHDLFAPTSGAATHRGK